MNTIHGGPPKASATPRLCSFANTRAHPALVGFSPVDDPRESNRLPQMTTAWQNTAANLRGRTLFWETVVYLEAKHPFDFFPAVSITTVPRYTISHRAGSLGDTTTRQLTRL